MIPASHQPDLRQIGESAFIHVLNTLLPLSKIIPIPASPDTPSDPPEIISTVLLTGPHLSGVVHVYLPQRFVESLVQRLIGIHPAAPGTNALLDDAAGELANTVAGRIAARLAEHGYPCTLGCPSVSRSAPPSLEFPPGLERGRADLICEDHRLAVKIQCRYPTP